MHAELSSDLEVGVRRIDDEHRTLLRELDAIAGGARETLAQMREMLALLSDHVAQHFLEEERYMVAADYPGLEAHRHEHARIAAYTSDAQDMLEMEPDERALGRTVRLLSAQVADHMHDADRDLARYLRALAES